MIKDVITRDPIGLRSDGTLDPSPFFSNLSNCPTSGLYSNVARVSLSANDLALYNSRGGRHDLVMWHNRSLRVCTVSWRDESSRVLEG